MTMFNEANEIDTETLVSVKWSWSGEADYPIRAEAVYACCDEPQFYEGTAAFFINDMGWAVPVDMIPDDFVSDAAILEARRRYRLGVTEELPAYAAWKTGRHAFNDATPWITIGKFFEDKPKCATIDPKVRSFIAAMIRTARAAGKNGFHGAHDEIARRAKSEATNIRAMYLYGIATIVRNGGLRNTERFADYT